MLKKRSGGKPAKDASLVEGFNPKPARPRDPVTGKLLPSEHPSERWLKRKAQLEAKAAGKRVPKKSPGRKPKTPPPSGESDLGAAYQLLEDMRWVYQQAYEGKRGGRNRLKELMKNDKEFLVMVKELMKIESALLSAKIRKDGGEPGSGNGAGFFVVLKGLDTDKEIVGAAMQNGIDVKQMGHAIDPLAHGEYEPELPEEKEVLPETPQEG